MNKLLVGLLSLIVAGLPGTWSGGDHSTHAASEALIEHRVVDRQETGSLKLSITVEVPLVGDRLPTAEELGALSEHFVSRYTAHDRTFVTFYLPGMEHGAGAFATAHHKPDMEVKVLTVMLAQYPQYARFAE